jgi:MFS family permease
MSRSTGFWAVAFAFLALTSFATAPSALYGLYARSEHLSGITLTIVYAIYAVGIVASLLLAGHLSDVHGRRTVLIPGLLVAAAASGVFLAWPSLPGLLVARLLTGVALGASVATATAYIADLDADADGLPSRRSGIVATVANVGGLAIGPLLAGLLAQYVPGGPTLIFIILLAALLLAVGAVARAPEGREPVRPRPRYRPQRLRAPAQARGQFVAATTGAFLTFAVGGLLAGLAGTFLAGPLHHPSAVLSGLVVFLNFGAGVLVQTTTTRWPAQRLIAAGLAPLLLGLIVLVASAWTTPASLALFLIGGTIAGLGQGAIIRGSLTVVISTASPEDRAGALATYFTAGYVGVSLPVLGAGVALQFLSPRVTLLIFAVAVGSGILAAAPRLVRRQERATSGTASAKRLSLYLNDHLADETRAVALVTRAISENEGTPLRAFMEVLSWELEADRRTLVRLMGELGIRPSRIKIASARLADEVSRLKPDGHSPLGPLVELESLHREIEGKLDMWKTLQSTVGAGVDFDELIRRAERQGEELERRRPDAAAAALAH